MRKILIRSVNALLVLMLLMASNAWSKPAYEIDLRVDSMLKRFVEEVGAGQEFLEAAKGVLVFPGVIKAGIGIGGEYGEGALRVNGETVQYYSTAAGSIGFQLGAQSKAIFVLFMSDDSLAQFRSSTGWKAGVDGSISLIKVGAAGAIDSQNTSDPILGFVLTNKGLMYNLTLEGTKMTKIVR
jgi:lipid-binding SYLF domain-containing protein